MRHMGLPIVGLVVVSSEVEVVVPTEEVVVDVTTEIVEGVPTEVLVGPPTEAVVVSLVVLIVVVVVFLGQQRQGPCLGKDLHLPILQSPTCTPKMLTTLSTTTQT